MPVINNLIYKTPIAFSEKKILKLLICVFILTHLFFSCKNKEEKTINLESEIEDLGDISGTIGKMAESGKSIFYGLSSPIELTRVFENIGGKYTQPVLNSTENASNYLTSSKIALNLGVYGVDLGYLQMVQLAQESINYWIVIDKLSDQLGIPFDITSTPRESIDESFNNPDSLVQIATTTFAVIKNQLKEQNRESVASMILIGGWIEALHITTEALNNGETPNQEIVEIIAEQKYSLNTLVSYVKNYHDDPEVAAYYRKLRLLQNKFKECDIYYEINDLKIDTTNKIIVASGNTIDISEENLFQIKDFIKNIRDEIIN